MSCTKIAGTPAILGLYAIYENFFYQEKTKHGKHENYLLFFRAFAICRFFPTFRLGGSRSEFYTEDLFRLALGRRAAFSDANALPTSRCRELTEAFERGATHATV